MNAQVIRCAGARVVNSLSESVLPTCSVPASCHRFLVEITEPNLSASSNPLRRRMAQPSADGLETHNTFVFLMGSTQGHSTPIHAHHVRCVYPWAHSWAAAGCFRLP